jgi:hypothetical protein
MELLKDKDTNKEKIKESLKYFNDKCTCGNIIYQQYFCEIVKLAKDIIKE